MLWDWLIEQVLDKLWTPRNQGVVALAGALLAAGVVAGLLSFVRLPVWFARAAGVVTAVAVASLYWTQITVTIDSVRSAVESKVEAAQQGGTSDLAYEPVRCGGVAPITATIRQLESGNQYDRLNGNAHTGATASGAYQYTNGTWNGYGGFKRAMDAPPHVQDERATADVTMFLERHNGDVSVIPVLWYIGHVPSGSEWDEVPWASQGNTLTPREYQTKWLAEYERQTAACMEVK